MADSDSDLTFDESIQALVRLNDNIARHHQRLKQERELRDGALEEAPHQGDLPKDVLRLLDEGNDPRYNNDSEVEMDSIPGRRASSESSPDGEDSNADS